MAGDLTVNALDQNGIAIDAEVTARKGSDIFTQSTPTGSTTFQGLADGDWFVSAATQNGANVASPKLVVISGAPAVITLELLPAHEIEPDYFVEDMKWFTHVHTQVQSLRMAPLPIEYVALGYSEAQITTLEDRTGYALPTLLYFREGLAEYVSPQTITGRTYILTRCGFFDWSGWEPIRTALINTYPVGFQALMGKSIAVPMSRARDMSFVTLPAEFTADPSTISPRSNLRQLVEGPQNLIIQGLIEDHPEALQYIATLPFQQVF